ncbi:glycerol-3-phosphate dehydrogenase/oxidase [Microbacterium koreense]|uniref:Glycerol-3-phosphate dehydrogenase n=1 Tax=Microbacterium koreense TaxID=323761 RepID=A0ABW2ZUA5_9MICO
MTGPQEFGTALNAARRSRELDVVSTVADVDVLVIGGGITGVGLALDAASRGLRTVLVERRDLAYGTSRWSSKLTHGGLRYLASGQFAIAHESAAERHLLMTRIAPHLTRPLAQVMPLYRPGHVRRGAYVGAGYLLGDALRRVVRTPSGLLRAPGALGRDETSRLLPALRDDDLAGAVRGWDGQVIDDARLVTAVARTAAGHGAAILTRCAAVAVAGEAATLRDEATGREFGIRARAIISAAGVWAGELSEGVHLTPSRGTHLVVDTVRLGGADVSLTVPIPGSSSRFVFTVPAPHGRTYIGLTDVPTEGEIPEVPVATDPEIDMLLNTVNQVLHTPLTRDDVRGTFAGLRPLLQGVGSGETSDLSRQHAVIESDNGVLNVVGGKLTTYRRMAEDGIDEAVRRRFAPGSVAPSRTRTLPLVGAATRRELATVPAPARFVRRFGIEAPRVAALSAGATASRGVSAQELEWGVVAEGALTIDDLLERRTRLGLVAAEADESRDAAAAAFARAGVVPLDV